MLEVCTVCWRCVLYVGGVYCMLEVSTVHWRCVLYIGGVYCMLEVCTVCWRCVLYAGGVYCVYVGSVLVHVYCSLSSQRVPLHPDRQVQDPVTGSHVALFTHWHTPLQSGPYDPWGQPAHGHSHTHTVEH